MQTYANVMFTRLWTKCPPMENWCVYIMYCVHTEPPKQDPQLCKIWTPESRLLISWQWFFKIVQVLIIGVSLSKLVGSLNNNKKDVNCVCDPMKSMNATYCLRLISNGSWRSAENVVSNEKYRCLPYNDKLRELKFFEGPFFCITAHRGWKTKRSKHREVSCNYWKGRSLNVVYVI